MLAATLFAMMLAAPRPPALPTGPSCVHIASSLVEFGYLPLRARQGSRLQVQLGYRDGPDGLKAIRPRCLKGWKVRGKGIVLSRDRRTILVRPDATPGAPAEISVSIGGKRHFARLIVRAADEPALSGIWHPLVEENCTPRPLGELVFTEDGRYIFTFRDMMVETMTSGDGAYRWNPVTGELQLGREEKGVFLPRETTRATLAGETLEITGWDIAGWAPPEEAAKCRIVLK